MTVVCTKINLGWKGLRNYYYSLRNNPYCSLWIAVTMSYTTNFLTRLVLVLISPVFILVRKRKLQLAAYRSRYSSVSRYNKNTRTTVSSANCQPCSSRPLCISPSCKVHEYLSPIHTCRATPLSLRGEFRPRQTRQLPRAVDLKGRLLSCQNY